MHVLWMKECHMSIQMLADKLNMGKDSVAMDLKEKMHRRKVCSQFVSHFLIPEQKQHCADC